MDTRKLLVSVKPVDAPGPILCSDDPEIVQAVVRAITDRYARPTLALATGGEVPNDAA